jgi:hypothetical protein
MTKKEGYAYIQKVLQNYDRTWRKTVGYAENSVIIEFSGMVDGTYLHTSVDFSDEDDVTVYMLLLDDNEQFCQENGFEDMNEAFSELNLWVQECIDYGYFWRYN